MPINNVDASSASSVITFKNCNIQISSITANQAKVLLVENNSRAYAFIQNFSSAIVTIIFGGVGTAALNKGMALLPYGSYEISSINLYLGVVSAICASDANVSLTECNK